MLTPVITTPTLCLSFLNGALVALSIFHTHSDTLVTLNNRKVQRGELAPITIAEAFAGGRGKPQGCGLRARKAGCRISPDPKPDAISRGHREAAMVTGGAGGVGGAAESAPNPFAYDGVPLSHERLANGTLLLTQKCLATSSERNNAPATKIPLSQYSCFSASTRMTFLRVLDRYTRGLLHQRQLNISSIKTHSAIAGCDYIGAIILC